MQIFGYHQSKHLSQLLSYLAPSCQLTVMLSLLITPLTSIADGTEVKNAVKLTTELLPQGTLIDPGCSTPPISITPRIQDSASNTQSSLPDPCLDKALKNIPNQPIPKILTSYPDTRRLSPVNPESFQTWIQSLQEFSTSTLSKITPVPTNNAKANNGIYSFKTGDGKTYFIKTVRMTPKGCEEFQHLLKLNLSPITHPECLQSRHSQTNKKPSSDQVAMLPRIAKIIAAGQDGKNCFAILEGAAGIPLDEVIQQFENGVINQEKLAEIFSNLGKSFGALHFLYSTNPGSVDNLSTWTHGDAHGGNIFLDPSTNQFTLIDNGYLDQDGSIAEVRADLNKLVFERLAVELDWFFQRLKPKLQKISSKEKISKSSLKKIILDADHSKELSQSTTWLQAYDQFREGYLKQFPRPLRTQLDQKLVKDWGQRLHRKIESIVDEAAQNQGTPNKAEVKALKSAIVETIPNLQKSLKIRPARWRRALGIS